MIRRSFRIGLMVGLLGGLALALVKTFGGRTSSPETDGAPVPVDPWPPLRVDLTEPVARPATPPVVQDAAPLPDPPVAAPSVDERPSAPAPAPVAKTAPRAKATKSAKTAKTTTSAPAKKATKASKATKTAAPRKKTPPARWVTPTGDACPTSHPVKAKLASKIFHVPGMLNYERTKPDRCYLDGTSAEADGLRPAKR